MTPTPEDAEPAGARTEGAGPEDAGREDADPFHCPVELTLDVLGGKWATVVLAHLKEGVHRYGELRRRIPEVSDKVLVQRLRTLEARGLVTRRTAGTAPWEGVTYDLTPEGRSLTPVLDALYAWGRARATRTGATFRPAG